VKQSRTANLPMAYKNGASRRPANLARGPCARHVGAAVLSHRHGFCKRKRICKCALDWFTSSTLPLQSLPPSEYAPGLIQVLSNLLHTALPQRNSVFVVSSIRSGANASWIIRIHRHCNSYWSSPSPSTKIAAALLHRRVFRFSLTRTSAGNTITSKFRSLRRDSRSLIRGQFL
jgi:hypothetical protein